MAKILVIESDADLLAVMLMILISDGHCAEGTGDGSVIVTLDKNKPDLILIDDWLRNEWGRDLCAKIKSGPLTATIPVILFSSDNNGEK